MIDLSVNQQNIDRGIPKVLNARVDFLKYIVKFSIVVGLSGL